MKNIEKSFLSKLLHKLVKIWTLECSFSFYTLCSGLFPAGNG